MKIEQNILPDDWMEKAEELDPDMLPDEIKDYDVGMHDISCFPKESTVVMIITCVKEKKRFFRVTDPCLIRELSKALP